MACCVPPGRIRRKCWRTPWRGVPVDRAGRVLVAEDLSVPGHPEVQVIGVETRGADAMSLSLAAGHLVELPAITSIARTLGAPKVSDFTMVNVEAPEMLAAVERGDIDGFAVWEPWPTRTLMAVKGAKVLQTAEGIYNNINFVYMNRGWIEQNKATAQKFMLSLMQANDLIEKDRPAAAKMVAKFLKMPLELATELMPKVEFDMDWQPRSIESIQVAEKQLADQKKLKAPLDYSKYVYMDLVKAVRPQNVKVTALPK